ncbi:MAG TPA: pyruvate dehydrogenase complex dihydrolipoamide acetyltransferase [Terriglobales bacterium]|nr:pyruvate dehydrogenase complex dihydrolipoamide acetyltransferase [Terriglobales bacterium]
MSKVVMPKLSEAMETGKIIKWIKKEGDQITGGDILAEVETDKADVEMEAFGSGILRKILVKEGDRAPVGALIAVIADANEDISALTGGDAASAASAPAAAPKAAEKPAAEQPAAAKPAAAPAGQPAPAAAAPSSRPAAVPPTPRTEDHATVERVESSARSGPGAAAASTTAQAPAQPAAAAGGERLKASPLARKVAAQSGVDLRVVRGSGPGGRIVRKDVEAAASAPAAAPMRPAAAAASGPEFEDQPLSQMRAIIAKRMPMSKAPVPHFYVSSEVAMDRAWELREELNGLEGQPKISVNDFVVRACALALLQHPGVNASFQGDSIRVHHRAHIGIAVALEEGLITPVLRDCHAKSLSQIAAESRDLAERARGRKLRAQEMSGATFSISNLGMYDVTEFSAIINPPEGAILAVGTVRKVPVVSDQGLGIGRRMMMTISCDHRVMDGAMGARFLQDVKRLLEAPLRLLV